MHTAKLLLTILAASMVLAAVLSSVPARAAAVAADPEARVVSLAQTGVSVQRQVDRLSRLSRAAHRGTWLRKHVARSAGSAVSLTSIVNGLNRQVLGLAEVDDATYSAVLRLNAQLLRLDRDAWRLSRKVLSGQQRGILPKMSLLTDQLRVLDGRVQDRWQALPAPTPTPTSIPARTFNVKDYGARGDGSMDDRPAIQKAVDACAAVGGGTVFMPAGTYLIDSGVVPRGSYYWIGILLKDNVQLVGDGASTQIRSSKSGLNSIGAVRAHNIAVGNLDTIGGIDQDGIKLGSCDGVTISGVNVFGHFIGIAAYGCTNIAITGCTSHDNSGMGFCLGDDVVNQVPQTGSHDQSWTNCEAYNNGMGFRIHNGGSATATDCYSHNNMTGLLVTSSSGLVVEHGRYDDNSHDVVHNTDWGGIALAGVHGGTFTGVEMSGNLDASGPGSTVQQVMAGTYGLCSNIVVQ